MCWLLHHDHCFSCGRPVKRMAGDRSLSHRVEQLLCKSCNRKEADRNRRLQAAYRESLQAAYKENS